MMRATLVGSLALWAAATVPGVHPAWAACNTIPTPREQLSNGPNPSPEAVALSAAVVKDEQRFGSTVPHKGALGRIDRTYLSPLREEPVRVAFDGQCVGKQGRAALVVDGTKNLVAAAIFVEGKGRKSTTLLATGEGIACEALTHTNQKERAATSALCRDGGITRTSERPPMFKLAFPADPPRASPRRARIVVFHAESAAAASATLNRLVNTQCDQACADAAIVPELGVCIDQLYAPIGLAGDEIAYAPDLVKCGLLEVPTSIPWNDFATLCQDGPGATNLAACQDASGTLSMWEDDCHGVYVPFEWTSIRQDDSGNAVNRVVRGQSAISRREKVEGGRIWVPGREYVGTLLEADLATGVPFVSDPRKAAIEVWYPSKEEFGLHGVVDKDKSIVHAVPRLATSYLCDEGASGASDEACMRVATQPAIESTRCACTDRYAADCTCKTLSQGQFFQCAGSKMPCTRHAHCNPNETCSEQPKCQKEGAVWGSSQPPPGGGGHECWTDEDCEKKDPANPQCGYLLFDVREKREPNDSLVKLDKTITAGGARKQRGACKATTGNQRKACSNGSGGGAPAQCGASEGDCVGYTLEALGEK